MKRIVPVIVLCALTIAPVVASAAPLGLQNTGGIKGQIGAARVGDTTASGTELSGLWEASSGSRSDAKLSAFGLLSGGFPLPAASTLAVSYASANATGLLKSGTPIELTWSDTTHTNGQMSVTPVPEPGTLILLGSGVAALFARRRQLRRA